MAFEDEFRKVVQAEPDSLYDGFVGLCRKALHSLSGTDVNNRYQDLRNHKFIAQDERDVDVYVVKVAYKHIDKFKWLYRKLYERCWKDFSKDMDLVVWGCGCGLDLLALYDQAREQGNPQLWIKVRHVTLVDISAAALERAKQICSILFPCSKIQGFNCDLADPDKIEDCVRLRQLTAYLPRVHLISNLLDLFDDVTPLAQAIKKVSRRVIGSYLYFNELIIAFSPEYRGGKVSENIKSFQNEWNEYRGCLDSIQEGGDEQQNCKFCSFAYRTLLGLNSYKDCFQSYMNGKNHVLNALVARCQCTESDLDLPKFVEALRGVKKGFYKVYRWVEVGRFKGELERVVFVPSPENSPRPAPMVVEIMGKQGEIRGRVEKSASRALQLLRSRRGDDSDLIGGREEDFIVKVWAGNKLLPGKDAHCDGVVDYSCYFRIDPGDVQPLPDLKEMDKAQKELILSRAQYRKVRGGAGCGKSTTMMWHAIMSIRRTHLPVLLTCKTTTLINRNEKRMAATLLKEYPDLEFVDSDLIKFKTLDKVLCEHSEDVNRCLIKRRCGECEEKRKEECKEEVPSWNCREWKKSSRVQLSDSDRQKCCYQCGEEACKRFARKNAPSDEQFTAYGAVMIDEVQSISPELVQAVVNMTYRGNPTRECYVFCDERQSLNCAAVEVDADTGKLRVKVPDRGAGYGRWVNLNKPYRMALDFSGRLTDVAIKLQSMTLEKYGAVELARSVENRQMSLSGSVFSIRKSYGDLYDEVKEEIRSLKENGEGSITVIFDDCDDARKLPVERLAKDLGMKSWMTTHPVISNHKEDQRLRMSFRENENGLQVTTVTLAQGWDFKNVVFVMTSELDEKENQRNIMENVLTGATRATSQLRILDRSKTSWLYDVLKEFNN